MFATYPKAAWPIWESRLMCCGVQWLCDGRRWHWELSCPLYSPQSLLVSGTSGLAWKGHWTQLLHSHNLGHKGGCAWSSWWRRWSDQDFFFNVLHSNFFLRTLKFYTIFKALAPKEPLCQQEMKAVERQSPFFSFEILSPALMDFW